MPDYLLNESLRAIALPVWTGPGRERPSRWRSRVGGVGSHCGSGCPHEGWE